MPENGLAPNAAPIPGDAGVEEAPSDASGPTTTGRTRLFRNVATALIFAVVAGGLVWFFALPSETAATSQSVSLKAVASGPPPHIGKPASDFRTFALDGSPVELSAYRGHPVWLTFWATWCPPCRAEAPDIQVAYQQYKDQGLIIVAVDLGEDQTTVRDYVQRLGMTFTVAGDPTTEVAALYRVNGLPSHFFIDSDGVLRDWKMGALGTKTIQQELAKILAPSGMLPPGK
jgi:cytochrome c biogenesis protein CcmG, thiol:disulfide interchange protein DsbE